MAADFIYDGEILPLFITPRKVRRSRCICLLFLFLAATFVGLAPIMVYRSLGAPLPEKLKGYRNVQPWMIVPQPSPAYGSPPPDGTDVQIAWSTEWQDPHETTTKPKAISIPKAHFHPYIPPQRPPSATSPDPPPFTTSYPDPNNG